MLSELVSNRTTSVVKLIYVALLNTDGEPVVAAGDTNLFSHESLAGSEIWSDNYVLLVLPMEGADVSPEGVTNDSTPTVVVSCRPAQSHQQPAAQRQDFSRRDPRPDENAAAGTNQFSTTNGGVAGNGDMGPPPPAGRGMTGRAATGVRRGCAACPMPTSRRSWPSAKFTASCSPCPRTRTAPRAHS